MDEKQLRKYPFFRKLGAFSVDRSHPRNALNALEYAVDALQQDHSSLYIFPQGKIESEFINPMKFEWGLAWLYRSLPNVDFVPIATTLNTRYSEKPRLFISIGTPMRSNETDRKKLTGIFEQSTTDLLSHIRDIAEHEHPFINRLM
jgi:1-acyl-sn-glycerol-3-phosphate acyltransferase